MTPHADRSSTRTLPALQALQDRPQWVCWRKEQRKGKLTKVPYNPLTGKRAESDNPATWVSYAHAQQALHAGTYHGVGYMFCRDYTGIDLDHCVNPDGSIDPWAQAYLDRLKSYAEYSPSHTGIHILVHGTIKSGIRRRVPAAPHPEAAIEMYCEKRYFTVTGAHLPGTPITIEASPALAALHAALTVSPPAQPGRRQPAPPAGDISRSDDALLEKAMQAHNGATFRALWQGDTSGYASHSEAELALCNLLAFWTGKDAPRMDRLFRHCALYRREKWDRPARSGERYGEGTIRLAIAHCSEVYHPPRVGKIIQLRGGHVAPGEEAATELPETHEHFVLECLRDEEEGDARLYAHLFQGKCVYDHTEGMWYEWHGHYWTRDECKHALVLVSTRLTSVYLDTSAQLSQEAAQAERQLDPDEPQESEAQQEQYQRLKLVTGDLIGRVKALKKLKRAQAVLTYAQAYLNVTARQWDRHIWLLACQNGVLDLRTGELHPGRPDDYIRTMIPTAWTGLETPAPRWERFLHEVFADRAPEQRAELVAFLQRLFGYGISGAVHEHVFAVLYGEEGRNGKDTIQHALSHTLGELSSAISKDVLLETGRMRSAGSATPHLMDLHGKRLAWASEPEKGARFSVGQVKELSGGGDIPARGMYEKHMIRVKPTHLLILLTNHKPYADPDDKAFWERLRLITFNMRFVTNPIAPNERPKDTRLWQELEAEASGILAWLVRGCLQWQRLGLASPEIVLSEGEAYRQEQDALDVFIATCCEVQEHVSVKASALFEAYTVWCKANNIRHTLTGPAFGRKMSKRFPQKEHTRTGDYYRGIGLRDPSRSSEGCEGSAETVRESEHHPSPAGNGLSSGTSDDDAAVCEGCEREKQELLALQHFSPRRGLPGSIPHIPHTQEGNAHFNQPVEPVEDGEGSKDLSLTQRIYPSQGLPDDRTDHLVHPSNDGEGTAPTHDEQERTQSHRTTNQAASEGEREVFYL